MKSLGLLSCALLVGFGPLATGQTPKSSPDTKLVAPSANPAERFLAGAGVVVDTRTRLVWAQADNALDTTWREAVNYCKRRGVGWRLPSVNELQTLHDAALSVPCGRWTCRASPLFRLSGPWFWSNQRTVSSQAQFVYLTDGAPGTVHVGNRNGLQAMCVRRS